VRTLHDLDAHLFVVVGHGLFLESFAGDHLLFNLVLSSLIPLEHDLGQDGFSPRVLFRYKITKKGPQIRQLIFIIRYDCPLKYGTQFPENFFANQVLNDISPIQAVDAIRAYYAFLPLYDLHFDVFGGELAGADFGHCVY
jgi:hypothetical protein